MKRILSLRLLIGALVVVLILGAGLALDLANHGLAWQFFWSQTGEEAPLGQIRGMIELGGNLIRPQPNTAPMTPIQYNGFNPYGINTFLNLEAESAKREEQVRMISAAGFTWIRQQFAWEDIEVDGRGQFTDSRNDHDGDGQVDTINGWDKYDEIVDLAEQYGLTIQVRLDTPPAWTHTNNPDIGAFAPPDDIQDYVNYAVAVATRYQGRLRFYQIWNEPNIYPEWGEQAVNPEAYTELLCRTYDALKSVDPNIVVISAAMAPTISLTGRDLNDFIYLQRMYDAGAGRCFDVMSVNGYGLNSGPTDRRMRPTTITFGRNQYIRDIMVANGDEHKPVWISEAAWNPVPQDDPSISDPLRFGHVTLDQAARYMPLGYERAQQEWNWVGVIFYWFFTRPDDSWRTQPQYYFRMVEPDYSAEHPTFTPLPIYTAMQDYIQNQQPVLYPGVYQAEDWRIRQRDNPEIENIEGATFGQAVNAVTPYFTIQGTDIILRWRGTNTLYVFSGCQSTPAMTYQANGEDWQETIINLSLISETRFVAIAANDRSVNSYAVQFCQGFTFDDTSFSLDSITVIDRTFANLFPLIFGVLAIPVWFIGSVVQLRWEYRRR
jgi:polysaccharide biosynthesis protein PslG